MLSARQEILGSTISRAGCSATHGALAATSKKVAPGQADGLQQVDRASFNLKDSGKLPTFGQAMRTLGNGARHGVNLG